MITFGSILSSLELRLEEMGRRLLEHDAYLRDPLCQTLASSEVERNSGPAPVFDMELDCAECLSLRLRIDTIFLAVPDGIFFVDLAGTVLATNCVLDGYTFNRSPYL